MSVTGEAVRRQFDQLRQLGQFPEGVAFRALRFAGSEYHFACISKNGQIGILVETESAGPRPRPIVLSGLSGTFGILCDVSLGGEEPVTKFMSVVTYTGGRENLLVFMEFVGSFLNLSETRPTMVGLADALKRFAALFASLSLPSKQSVIGIIGELMLMDMSTDPAAAISNWRRSSTDHFDYVAVDARVECKSTSSSGRLHSLSWEQCNPPDGPALLASLRVESAGGGTKMSTLIQRIEGRVQGDLDAAVRLRETIATTMGASLARALEFAFDESLCRATVQWFDLREVPAIRGQLPDGVTGLRFTSDLTRVQAIRPDLLVGTGLACLTSGSP